MVTASEMATDARVCREAESLVKAGFEVRILCLKSSVPARIRDATLIERGYGSLPRKLRLVVMTFDFFLSTLIRRADIYHAHNVPALPGCWLAARARRAHLVYDAHELYAISSRLPKGQAGTHTKRQYFEAAIERRLAPRADIRLTASDGYAQVIAAALGIDPPISVPNYPPLPPIIKNSPLRGIIGAKENEIVILYQGGFYLSSRSLDVLVRAMRQLPQHYRLVLLGFGVSGEERLLAELADSLGVADRVTVLPPVAHQDLAQYTAGADIGVIPLKLTDDATRLCAPNKLYEYFQAGVPVLSTAAEELQATLTRIAAGRVYQFDSPDDFAAQVLALGESREKLQETGRRGRIAAEAQYSWAAVEHTLVDAYEGISATPLLRAPKS